MKNQCLKMRDKDNPYEVWTTPDGSWEWRVLKKWQVDDDKPYARYFCAVKSPYTFGRFELGDVYVSDIKDVAGIWIDPDKAGEEVETNCACYHCGKQMVGKGVEYQGTYFCDNKCIKDFDEKVSKIKEADPQRPEYDKCNEGHQLVLMDGASGKKVWDCPICKEEMEEERRIEALEEPARLSRYGEDD